MIEREILEAARAFYDTLVAYIEKIDDLAQKFSMMSYLVEQDGNQIFADVLRSLSRRHRVEVLGLCGQLALLEAEFGAAIQPWARSQRPTP